MATEKNTAQQSELQIQEQLEILYALQSVDSRIDRIEQLQGSLPLEVSDLEDEIEGLKTRVKKIEGEIAEKQQEVSHKKIEIKTAESLIAKYSEQQKNVRNNREYDALSKELEFQNLEIELRNKQIRDAKQACETLKAQVETANAHIKERQADLKLKQEELESIIKDTATEVEQCQKDSEAYLARLPERLQIGYKRIRKSAHNGLAVVTIVRGACGGCFNRIPPQRQLEVRLKKKLIVCEYCGRIIVAGPTEEQTEEE